MGLQPRPGELLDQVVLLVRQPGGGEESDRLRAVPLDPPPQARRDRLERVLPRRLVELAVVAAYERLGEAVGAFVGPDEPAA